jgi:hypothetical protein
VSYTRTYFFPHENTQQSVHVIYQLKRNNTTTQTLQTQSHILISIFPYIGETKEQNYLHKMVENKLLHIYIIYRRSPRWCFTSFCQRLKSIPEPPHEHITSLSDSKTCLLKQSKPSARFVLDLIPVYVPHPIYIYCSMQ